MIRRYDWLVIHLEEILLEIIRYETYSMKGVLFCTITSRKEINYNVEYPSGQSASMQMNNDTFEC